MLTPLFTKYRTKNGKHYLYDCGTGRIIEVDGTIFALVDDYRVLSESEMLAKYRDFGVDEVRRTLGELDGLVAQGYLVPHEPTELSRIDGISLAGTRHDIEEFWCKTAVLLVLGITERCNLCCEYCCFSGNFTGQRTHSQRSMTWEIAEKAISSFLENDQAGDGTCPISFYGGEPLLESHLLKECVRHAGDVAQKQNKKVRFALTTNGTLLDDDAVDFLVEHDFLILISFDGPKTMHDRYRLFPNKAGSFDTVYRNVKRFAERYPDYRKRGLNVVLAPPLNLEATERFVAEFLPDYPLTRVSLVNTGTDRMFRDVATTATRYGCHAHCSCSENPVKKNDSFRNFRDEDVRLLKGVWKACVGSITMVGLQETRYRMPLAMLLFESQIDVCHRRSVTKRPPDWFVNVPCLPGFTRRFVDVNGNYRVCERVDDSQAYRMGDVWNGPDPARLLRTMELRRHFGDCANCSALKTCDICYARIPESDAVQNGFDPRFDLLCQQTRKAMDRLLTTYTEIMEVNPKAFDRPEVPSAFPSMKFGSTDAERDECVLARMELEKVQGAAYVATDFRS